MSISTSLTEEIRKSQLSKDSSSEFYIKKAWVIIPFYVSGVQNYSNRGFVDYDINPNYTETFKRIWTGNDSCCIVWEDSVKIVSSNDKFNVPVLSFQLGKYKLGFMTSNFTNNEVKKDISYSEYISQQINNQLTFTFTKDFPFTAIDNFKFYKIPRFSKDDIYKVVSVHRTFNNLTKEVDYYTVTFESVNQSFASTGKARQQNINMSSVGQGYLNPVVMSEVEFSKLNSSKLVNGIDYLFLPNSEYLLADKNKFNHRPAKKAIIKMYGNALPISFSFVGRPVFYNDPPDRLRALRLIFPCTIEQPITPNLQRTSNSTNNWYFGDFEPRMDAWKDIMTSIKDNVNNIVAKQEFNGNFFFSKDKVVQTNPLVNNTNYLFSVYDIKINDIWTQWKPGILEEYITVKYTYGVREQDGIFKKFGVNKSIIDLLFDNYWIYKNDLQIPLSIKETKTFGSFIQAGLSAGVGSIGSLLKPKKNWLNIFSLLGSAAALLGIGISYTLSRTSNPTFADKISGLVSASFLDLSTLQFDKTLNGFNCIPLTSFNNNEVDVVNSALFNTPNSFNFQAQMELTDLFENTKSDFDNKINPTGIYSTTSIGQQDKFENEIGNLVTHTGWKILMDGTQKVQPHRNIAGYIIEQINIDSCFAGEISVEFLDETNQVIYSGIYQSEAKWTGNIRDRKTTINTSIFNNQNVFQDISFVYPKNILEPKPEFWNPTNVVSEPIFYIQTLERDGDKIWPIPNTRNITRTNLKRVVTNQFKLNTPITLFQNNKWANWSFIINNYNSLFFNFTFGGIEENLSIQISDFVKRTNSNNYYYNFTISNINKSSFRVQQTAIVYYWWGNNVINIREESGISDFLIENQIISIDLEIEYNQLTTSFVLIVKGFHLNNNLNWDNWNTTVVWNGFINSPNCYFFRSFDKQQVTIDGIKNIQLIAKNNQ